VIQDVDNIIHRTTLKGEIKHGSGKMKMKKTLIIDAMCAIKK
jgi:hypothetical protein